MNIIRTFEESCISSDIRNREPDILAQNCTLLSPNGLFFRARRRFVFEDDFYLRPSHTREEIPKFREEESLSAEA